MKYPRIITLSIISLFSLVSIVIAKEDSQRHSADYPDAEIKTVIRSLADVFEINVVIPDTLQGRTSVKLRDVTWQQAFEVLLEPIDWTYQVDGSIILIKPRKELAAVKKDMMSEDLLSSLGAMQITESKKLLRDKDYAEALADFHWNLYTALVRKGFSKEQALQIVLSSGSKPTIAND